MAKDWIAIAVVALIVAGVVIYSRHEIGASQQIVLAENQVPLSSLTVIAAHNGYFAKRGLNVVVKPFPSGKLALDAGAGGGADVATVQSLPSYCKSVGHPGDRDRQIALSSDDVKVAYRKDQGITQPTDLRGKIIATAVGTSAEYFLDLFLAKYDLKTTDVKIINLSPSTMVQALTSGDIAAFAIFEPYPNTAQSILGAKVGIFDVPGLYQETFNIAVRPEYACSNASAEEFLD